MTLLLIESRLWTNSALAAVSASTPFLCLRQTRFSK